MSGEDDLGWRFSIEDAFSGPLDALEAGARAGETAFGALGKSADASMGVLADRIASAGTGIVDLGRRLSTAGQGISALGGGLGEALSGVAGLASGSTDAGGALGALARGLAAVSDAGGGAGEGIAELGNRLSTAGRGVSALGSGIEQATRGLAGLGAIPSELAGLAGAGGLGAVGAGVANIGRQISTAGTGVSSLGSGLQQAVRGIGDLAAAGAQAGASLGGLTGRLSTLGGAGDAVRTVVGAIGGALGSLSGAGDRAGRALSAMGGWLQGAVASLGDLRAGSAQAGGTFGDLIARLAQFAGLTATSTQAGGALGSLAGSLRSLGGAGGAAGAALAALGGGFSGFAGPAAAGVTLVARLATGLGELGAQTAQTGAQFAAFSGGATAAQGNLRALDGVLGNALTNAEKMATAAALMGESLGLSAPQAARVAEAALLLGDAHQTAAQRIAAFNETLRSGSLKGLGQFGISAQAVQERMRTLQASTAGLSAEQARLQAVLGLVSERLSLLKEAGGQASTGLQKFRNAWEDLRGAVATKLSAKIDVVADKATGTVNDLSRKLAGGAPAQPVEVGALGAGAGAEDLEAGLAQIMQRSEQAQRSMGGLGRAGGAAAPGVRGLAGSLGLLKGAGEAGLGILQDLTGVMLRFAGPAGIGLAIAALGRMVLGLGQMGMESKQVEARFQAFSGGALAATQNLAAMNATLGASLTEDDKMAESSRIMSLGLASTAAGAARVAEAAAILGDAHQTVAQRIDAFTQMLATGSTRGLAAYGISAQQVTDRMRELKAAHAELSDAEAKQQAILDVANAKMEAVKASGGSATTAVQDFSNSWADLKDAVASKVSPTIEVVVKGSTGAVQDITRLLNLSTEMERQRAMLQDLGGAWDEYATGQQKNVQIMAQGYAQAYGFKAPATPPATAAWWVTEASKLDEYRQKLTQLDAAKKQALATGMSGSQADAQYLAGLAALNAAFEDYKRNQIALADVGDVGYAWRISGGAANTASAALTAYNEALSETADKLAGVNSLAAQMGNAAGALQALTQGVRPMPELPKTLGVDTGPLRAWAQGLAAVGGEQGKVATQFLADISAFDKYQQAELLSAAAADTQGAGLRRLAIDAGVASGSALELANKWDTLSQSWQAGFSEMGGFSAAYNEAMAKAIEKAQSLNTSFQQLVSVGAAFRGLASGPQIAMPEAPTSFNYDTGPMEKWLAAARPMSDEEARLIQQTREQMAAFQSAQQAVLAHAMSLSTEGERLDYLARAFLGPQAGIDDLIANLGKLPPSVRAAIDPVELLTVAIGRLQSQAAAPVMLDVRLQGMQSALSQIDSMALSLAGGMPVDTIKQWRQKAADELTQKIASDQSLTKFDFDLMLAEQNAGYDKMISSSKSYYSQSEADAKGHLANIAGSASELQSKIEAALSAGNQVDKQDVLDTASGNYKDKAMENARRLDAIMQRGFNELKAHPDWAAALKIPPEVLSGSEIALKDWAGRTAGDVRALTRPDMINWDAFGAQWDKMQQDQAAKDFTIDTAVTFLDKSGRLKGKTKAEAAKEIAKLMGMETPELSIDALFQAKGKPSDLVTQYLGGPDKKAQIPAEFVISGLVNHYKNFDENGLPITQPQPVQKPVPGQMNNKALGGVERAEKGLNILTDGLTGGSTQISDALTRAMQAADLKPAGSAAAVSMLGGMYGSFKDPGVGLSVATNLTSAFAANDKAFAAIGTWAGGQIIDATAEAAGKGAPAVIKRIAVAVAPEVWAIIEAKGKGKAALQ